MEPNDAYSIDFGGSVQRDAALNILQSLKNFFGTESLSEIDDLIDDERLSNDTSGLSKNEAVEIQAYLEEIKASAVFAGDSIAHALRDHS